METNENNIKINFSPEDLIFKQGDLADGFYIIEEGQVEIFIYNTNNDSKDKSNEIKIGILGQGEVLGEVSVITQAPRNATARAITQVVATQVTSKDYSQQLEVLPKWIHLFLNGLAKKIHNNNQRIIEEHAKALKNAIENARMGKELTIAKTVQDTLFPKSIHQIGNLSIAGHYESATECGGDWWHVYEIGNKVLLWLGDATGHGVSAALVVSAARAVASVLEYSKEISTGNVLNILNRAIYDTSKGKIMMTFFLACYDPSTATLCYSNASHEPVFVCRDNKLILLDKINNIRLGEDPEYQYEEIDFALLPNDILLAYTDGVTGLVNPKKRTWGEVNLLKAFLKAVQASSTANEISEHLKNEMKNFQQKATLQDDVTFFVVHHK